MICVVYVLSVKHIVTFYMLCNVENKLSFEDDYNLDVLSKGKEAECLFDNFLCFRIDL